MSAETRQAGKNILHRNKSPPQTVQKQQSALVSFILTRHRSVTLTQPRLTSEHWQESLVSIFYHMYKIRLPDWLHVYRVQVLHKQLFSFPWPTKPAQPNAASSCTLMTLHWSYQQRWRQWSWGSPDHNPTAWKTLPLPLCECTTEGVTWM